MGPTFGTPEWAERLRDEINSSSEYRNAAAGWGVGFNGNLLLAFEADAALLRPSLLLVRLSGGACSGVEFVREPVHPEAGFALRAPFGVWRDVLERRTLAATAILTGKMRVEGETSMLFKFLGAHRALLHCTASLDTVFPHNP